MTLGLLYEEQRDKLPVAIASDRGEKEISDFLHLHGYRCRPKHFLTWARLFPGPEYNQLLAEMPDRLPRGVNNGRHAFYQAHGDVQLLARKHLAEVFFTRLELSNVLADQAVSFQSLFDWHRHVRFNTFEAGKIEILPTCHHGLALVDCELCQVPDGCKPPPAAAAPISGPPEWRPTRKPRNTKIVDLDAVWRLGKKLSAPKSHAGGSL